MTLHEKVVLSAYTGILMVTGPSELGAVYKYIEKLIGRPILTHELASETLWAESKKRQNPTFSRLLSRRRT